MRSKKFIKTKKQETIRIMVNNDTLCKLNEVKNKYKASLSTITQILIESFNVPIEKNFKQQMCNEYMFENKKDSTIKPKINGLNPWGTKEQRTKFISNLLYLYVNKKLKDHVIQYDKFQSQLNKSLCEVRETYWNLNTEIRTQKRALKILGIQTQ